MVAAAWREGPAEEIYGGGEAAVGEEMQQDGVMGVAGDDGAGGREAGVDGVLGAVGHVGEGRADEEDAGGGEEGLVAACVARCGAAACALPCAQDYQRWRGWLCGAVLGVWVCGGGWGIVEGNVVS